ncbi:MAG: hypothetical protein HY962_08735 [Ignavibacteriae bacterium]|nr:hypothetical protein [Ignavibacteriota bacterium]
MSARRAALLVLLLAAPASALAQVQYSVGNFLRYGNGTQMISGTEQRKEYLENQTNVRLFWNDFTVGFQYLYDDPPEFGPRYQGIRKRYVEYAREGLELRAGDFFTLYGKGLSMNLFENRAINYDTGLDGLRGEYHNDYLNAIMAVGTMRYYDLLNSAYVENYAVKSGYVEVTPVHMLRLGASLTGVSGESPRGPVWNEINADILGATMALHLLGFDLSAEYSFKRSFGMRHQLAGDTRYDRSGDAWYGSLSYTHESGFGATFEYKNYKFDPVNPLEKTDVNRPTRMLPMQNPPIVHKEHAFTLLVRRPHTIDFNDEVGWQIDAFYALSPTLTVALNGAVASRQKSYLQLPGGTFRTIKKTNDLFPALDAEFSPFWEAYAEVEWYFDGQSYLRAAFNRRYDAPYEEVTRDAHVQTSTTIPVRLELMLDEAYSVGISLEQQWAHDNTYAPDERSFFNEFVSVTLSRAPTWAVSLRGEFTNDANDPSGKKSWITGEFSYRLGNVHTATVSYGTERGGLICSNGICRVVQPFEGVRFQLLTQL